MTMQAMRSEAEAISSARSTPRGLSIMSMIGRCLPPASSSSACASSTSSRDSTLGKSTASMPVVATAFTSSRPHGESRSFTRTTTSRRP